MITTLIYDETLVTYPIVDYFYYKIEKINIHMFCFQIYASFYYEIMIRITDFVLKTHKYNFGTTCYSYYITSFDQPEISKTDYLINLLNNIVLNDQV